MLIKKYEYTSLDVVCIIKLMIQFGSLAITQKQKLSTLASKTCLGYMWCIVAYLVGRFVFGKTNRSIAPYVGIDFPGKNCSLL